MKLLFINLPYYGHVVPTIGLVQELIKNGCEVTYLMPFDWQDKIAESGAAFYGYENHRKLSEQIKSAYRAADEIKEIQKLIGQAPGNRGGAEKIMEYYGNTKKSDGL